ncbi:MAG: hypothetical protein KF770_17570 [Anaerolineae bacterium]|nr:hypothetical protein [Anaerolineae bacterium]
MARPHLDYEPVMINVKLTLHPEHDADLIAWFGQVPGRSRAMAVIAALRTGGVDAPHAAADFDGDALAADLLALVF